MNRAEPGEDGIESFQPEIPSFLGHYLRSAGGNAIAGRQ